MASISTSSVRNQPTTNEVWLLFVKERESRPKDPAPVTHPPAAQNFLRNVWS